MKLKEVIEFLQEKIEEGVIDGDYELNSQFDDSKFVKHQWMPDEVEEFKKCFSSNPEHQTSGVYIVLDLMSKEYKKFIDECC